MIANLSLSASQPVTDVHIKAAREASEKLEAAFLSEMLKSSGFAQSRSTFGGGVGEDQFASFLRDAQAREMVRAGGIGLAAVFEAQLLGDEK